MLKILTQNGRCGLLFVIVKFTVISFQCSIFEFDVHIYVSMSFLRLKLFQIHINP